LSLVSGRFIRLRLQGLKFLLRGIGSFFDEGHIPVSYETNIRSSLNLAANLSEGWGPPLVLKNLFKHEPFPSVTVPKRTKDTFDIKNLCKLKKT